MRALPVSLLLLPLLMACPERRYPERGVELRYQAPPGARAAVEKRLAALHLAARLAEEEDVLVVRVREGQDVGAVKVALARSARLELCEEDTATQRAWCQRLETGPLRVRPGDAVLGCLLEGEHPAPLDVGDAGVRVLVEKEARGVVLHAAPAACFTPVVVEAHAKADRQLGATVVALTFAEGDASSLAALTGRLLRQRLLLVLDGAVVAAPVVQEAIPGGKVQLLLPGWSPAEAELAAAALVGSLPRPLQLVSERAYGPPSLNRGVSSPG